MKRNVYCTILSASLTVACTIGTASNAAAELHGCNQSMPDSHQAIEVPPSAFGGFQQSPRLGSFNIVLVPGAGLSGNAPALAAFQRAADQWEAWFSDPITVTINANLADLAAGVGGQTDSVLLAAPYAGAGGVRAALVLDASNETDEAIVASLPASASWDMPNSFTAHASIASTKANFKALGYTGLDGTYGASDGTISFNTDDQADWDFDRTNGVPAGKLDFEAIAAHEIGHLLGFNSGVDTIDTAVHAGTTSGAINPWIMDAVRFRNDTAADPASSAQFGTFTRSLRYNTDDISDDTTFERRMSTGLFNGDGWQASHWKTSAITGIIIGQMDAAIETGTIRNVVLADVRQLDMMGYDFEPCGDGSLSGYPYEICDDGNRTNGDCCSSTCNFDGSGTPCTPDANACTVDVCNSSGTCTHPSNSGADCNDGVFCNGTDTCSGASCSIHHGNPCTGGAECNNSCNEAADNCQVTAGTACTTDGNVCTNDVCSGGNCTHASNSVACNDGLFCNGADTCSGGSCSQHVGNPCTGGADCNNSCNEGADNCLAANGSACSTDANTCTDDVCSGGGCTHVHNSAPCSDDANGCTNDVCAGGSCQHPANTAPCEDGLFCNGADTCSGTTCSSHAGDPCSGGAECADVCDEGIDTCDAPAETPCTSDDDVCTADVCDGAGQCEHEFDVELDPGCSSCPPEPLAGCFAESKFILSAVGGSDPAKKKLTLKWVGGEVVDPTEFGNPGVFGTTYQLCIYSSDGMGAVSTLAATRIDRPGSWSGAGTLKMSYKDPDGFHGGISSIKLVAGVDGKSSMSLKAKGPSVALPGPASAEAFFDPSRTIIVQFSNDLGKCWGSAFQGADVAKNLATKAKIADDLHICGDGVRDKGHQCDGEDNLGCSGSCDSLCVCEP